MALPWGPAGPPVGSPRSKVQCGCTARWPASPGSGSASAGAGWLAFRISAGFRLDSWSRLALAWVRLDCGFWLSFDRILIGFDLIFVEFHMIWFGLGWIRLDLARLFQLSLTFTRIFVHSSIS